MEKRFKLRISKAVSTFHSSCRSKDPSILPQNPVPSFFQSSSLNPNTQLITTVDNFPITPPPPSISHHHQHPHRSSFKRHVSTVMVTAGCRCSSRNGEAHTSNDNHTRSSLSQEFKWKKEDKWHTVKIDDDTEQPHRKISNSSASDDSDSEVLALPPPSHSTTEKNKRRNKQKKNKTRFSMSTSSADESGNFSSEIWDEEEDETETLVSSCRSLEFSSTDSSPDSNQQLETIYETTKTRRQKRTSGSSSKRRPVNNSKRSILRGMNIGKRQSFLNTSSDKELPPRLSVFKKLIPCNVDGKVKESFAIVKKSKDPYEDFKRSMMEMIFEKQMFEKNDLEQLLQCFLSLNAKHYHGMIVEAFSEIWMTLFSPNHN